MRITLSGSAVTKEAVASAIATEKEVTPTDDMSSYFVLGKMETDVLPKRELTVNMPMQNKNHADTGHCPGARSIVARSGRLEMVDICGVDYICALNVPTGR